MFFSFLSRFYFSKSLSKTKTSTQKVKKSPETLKNATLKSNGLFLENFTLFYRDQSSLLDIVIFLPHYGLYVGEKISWKINELHDAKIERFRKGGTKKSTTRFNSTEGVIQQKLEDVLSFNFTPIERFVWMENLSESEFDTLNYSFHEFLPKNRVIFNSDTIQTIQTKLASIGTYQSQPHSTLKVLGSLMAHTLLLPTTQDPFGAFLSQEQQTFLDTPLTTASIHLHGEYGSGKTTVLIRKIIDILLQHPHSKVLVITPTLLSAEIFREEIVRIVEFSVITLNLSNIHFLPLTLHKNSIETLRIFRESSIIVCDDAHLFNTDTLTSIYTYQGDRPLFISSTTLLYKGTEFQFQNCYRSPHITHLYCPLQEEILPTLFTSLKKFENLWETEYSILIILCDECLISDFKESIDNHLHLNAQILTNDFSLQHKNLNSITLSTPQFINAVEAQHCFLINLNPDDPLYTLALSRASESVTLISDIIHPKRGEA